MAARKKRTNPTLRRWSEVDALLRQALERPTEERPEFLAEACRDDTELHAAVGALLAASEEDTSGLATGAGVDGPLLQELLEELVPEASPPGFGEGKAKAMALDSGTRLGNYEVVSSLGAGGMGEVYRARDEKLGREVAIKLLRQEVSNDPERLARFTREARVLASLNHPNIATLHGFETAQDTPFLVMELVEGETLAERIKRGAIPVEEALALFLQIADGLEAAHDKGVIHRDLKPANIKVTDEGAAKILDFGLAKAMTAESTMGDPNSSESPTLTAAATKPGQILGTTAYMSPEQAKGGAVDKRADVWAFGACLYEALTGERAFQGDSAQDVLGSVLKLDPAWDALPSATPTPLRRLLRRCLEKNPNDRLRDIGDARLELCEAFATPASDEPTTREVSKERRSLSLARASVVTGAVTAAIAVIAGLAFWTSRPDPIPPERLVVRSVLSAAPSASVTVSPFGRDLAVGPDGRVVVYQSEGSLYARPTDSLVGSQLAGTEGASTPFFSPDGAWVGFAAGGSLKKVSLLGGPTVRLADLAGGILTGASWGADDTIILGFSDGLYRVSAEGGRPELLLAPDPERREIYRSPELLPGGQTVLFTLRPSTSPEQEQIMALSLSTRKQKVLLYGGGTARYVPTGHLVYGLNGALLAVAFDAESLEVRGNPVSVLEGVSSKAAGRTVSFDFSQNGSLAYVTSGGWSRATLALVGRDGQEEVLSTPPLGATSILASLRTGNG